MHAMRRIMRIKPPLLSHHKCNNKVNILIIKSIYRIAVFSIMLSKSIPLSASHVSVYALSILSQR
jgi:hypothetical protein